jgi:heme ABC exporter ATP-binding subunit CcmA
MTATPLVQVTGLSRSVGGARVLDGVRLDVHAGEALALLGPNGAGKTTLLKILATLQRPTRGTARVAGWDCVKDAERVRQVVGLLAHGSWVYEDLTALENLRFWTTLAGLAWRADEGRAALAELELDRFADDRARTFSAGMARRLSLARFLLTRPRVLLLDEPAAGLDQRARKWLEGYLETFKGRGGTVVMATHSFGRELAGADRIAILAGGRIALEAPRATLPPDELARVYALHTEEGG